MPVPASTRSSPPSRNTSAIAAAISCWEARYSKPGKGRRERAVVAEKLEDVVPIQLLEAARLLEVMIRGRSRQWSQSYSFMTRSEPQKPPSEITNSRRPR